MRYILLSIVLVSLVTSLVGCGGSSDSSRLDPTTPILGSWQPISGTEDGTPVAMSTAMNWNATWTRGILQFSDRGILNLLGFKNQSQVGSINGTWTSAPGVATITLSGQTTAIAYSITGNVLTATFSRGGHDYVTTWVKVVDLPERDPALADLVATADPAIEHSWTAASITTTPVGVPAETLRSFFGLAADINTAVLILRDDGTASVVEKNGVVPVGTKNGQWFTGGGEIALTQFKLTTDATKTVFDSETRGFYTLGAQLTTTFVDVETGQTVVIVWDPVP